MSIHPESATAIQPGTVIADTYEVTHLIGRGDMGAVWAANHRRLPGTRVAVKVLLADVAGDAESLARFRREAEVASKLGHPNIVQVIDFNTLPDGAPYLVLELLSGESLDQRLSRGPLAMAEAMTVVRQIGAGLHAAHREGVIHRDLKPQNVFLCPTEMGGDIHTQVKVLDFGISKIRGSQTIKTQESTILGTPQYMAPEQATGAHDKVDARTDVFALGAMVYEMLSGTPAFAGQSVPEVVFKVVYEEPPPLAELAPHLTPAAVEAVNRALAKNQDDRFGSVSEFVEAMTGRPLVTLRGHTPVPELIKVPDDSLGTAETQHLGSLTDPMAATVISGEHDDKVALPSPSMPMPSPSGVVGINKSQDASAYAQTMHQGAGTTDSVEPPPPPRKASRAPIYGGIAMLAVAVAIGAFFALRGKDDAAPAAKPARRAAKKAAPPAPAPMPAVTADAGAASPTEAVTTTATDAVAATDTVAGTGTGTGTGTVATAATVTDVDAGTVVKKRSTPTPAAPEDSDDDTPPSADLLAAEKALKSGDGRTAVRLAKRSLIGHPRGPLAGRAYAVITVGYCMSSDFSNARASLRKVPRRLKRRAIRGCADTGIELR